MNEWFTIDRIDEDTFILSEYRHWEETHAYLLLGSKTNLLIDTGLGICDIREQVLKFTQKPVIAAATHIHWDHIGGHRFFPDFYAHKDELHWLNGEFPLSLDQIKAMVIDRCDIPVGYDVNTYEFFQGTPTRILDDNDEIDLGGRIIKVLHTPGHSPGHMCFWEKNRRYLFTGDLVYKDTLFAYYPSTDPQAYLSSLERIAVLPVARVFPAHHSLDIRPEILIRMRNAFQELNEEGKLKHGTGICEYGDWAVWL
ncbi:Zn-dependent hydrolase, glyoxylase [Sphaerochaeta pleomorpha str. Grapes]|uniref:Zn-dependent hydrolase, glyoxylase n=1 Tax=Sphaerochaeta pleomorpha (strain ATCC BAA-1885 / DSM 22778 / Grapes) TaxID=158190 RepID=G8QW03_SPHPG|nr:MBL fold metallo-hydrolase [Sphaerochaeta pleomorpha]AEV30527.1 Zn-dependent hydrolase, glyoxylase [Sphaerochaeta pleomorpha str. Grapes]